MRGNTLFVGGFFLDDVVFRNTATYVYQNLAALDATTGKWLPWKTSADGTVLSLAILDNTLYVGGVFTAVNGSPRTYAAALNPNDGSLLPFAPVIQGDITQVPTVNSFAIQNDAVIMGGVFASVDGRPSGNLSGTASASVVAPPEPVASISFINPRTDGTGYTVQWTPPTSAPAGYTIIAVEGTSAPTGTPQNGESYTGNTAFTATPTVPFSGQVVYDGTGTSAAITGLIPNTNYTFIVYPYNGSGIARTYGVAASAVATGRTSDITPPVVALHPGILTVSSATLSFGDVALGTSRTRRYTMYCTNLTTASVVITPPAQCEVSVGGTAFSAAPVVFTTRATIDRVDIRVRFTPSANSPLAGTITHIAGSTGAVATLNGTSSPPSITVSTLSLNFGAVVPSSTATRVYRVNYRNLATRTITITPPAGFAVSTTGTAPFLTSPLTVQTGISGRFNVYTQFTPPSVGIVSGTLRNDNPDAPPIALLVEGVGEFPRPGLGISSLNFGAVPIGACKTLSYTLTPAGGISEQATIICPNSGYGDVEISTNGPGGPFSSGCQTVVFSRLAGITSARIWVRYCPTTDAPLSTSLSHTSMPGSQFVTLPLTGSGARPEIEILNPTVNFGNVNLGSTAASVLRVRYRNVTLPGTITLSTAASHPFLFDNLVSGIRTDLPDFSTSATATGATFSVRVSFAPTVTGLVRTTFAAVCVAANGTTSDTFTLIGTGIGAGLTANNNQTLAFGNQFLLTPTTRAFPLQYRNITTATIDIQPTAHPAFLLMDPQTGVFSTTAGITLTVGGTAANPVSSTSTLFVRFLPLRGGATSATLTFISSTTETLRLTGNGLAPYLNVTQGTVQFGQVDLGQTRYYGYSMTYRNITASTISVAVPAGNDFAVAQVSSGTWTTAGQTLTLPTVQPPTNATTQVQLWLRFTPTIAQATTVTLTHLSDGGDLRTVDSDVLVLTARKPPVLIELTPKILDFGTVGVNGSSTQTFSLAYQNVGSPITLTLPSGISARLASAGNFASGSFSFTPPNFFGTLFVELQYSPTAAETLNRNVSCVAFGTTATLVTVRGRATTAQIFTVSPSTITFTSALPPLNRATHIARIRYIIEVANVPNVSVPNTQIRLTTTDGFSVEYVQGPGEYDAPAGIQNTALTSAVFLQRSTTTRIHVILRARYNNAATLTGTVRHDIVQDGNVLATVNLPVTVNFVECPGRVDTIRVMAVYTDATRRHLAENNTSISKIIERSEKFYMPPVFRNSGIPNVFVKFVNPDGDLVTEVAETAAITDDINSQVQIPGSRLFTLRESIKADVVCVFNISGETRSTGVANATPNQEQTTFAVDVKVPIRKTDVEVLQHSLTPEALPYIILHELGHICGGDHEPGAPTGCCRGSSQDAQGFISSGQRVVYPTTSTIETFITGTIMFHGGGTNGPVIRLWVGSLPSAFPTGQIPQLRLLFLTKHS